MENIKIDEATYSHGIQVTITLEHPQFNDTAILLEALRILQMELIRHEYKRNY
jgi:subtilisin-like proprotein convertase family protein